MPVKKLVAKITGNDYVFTIFTKIAAVVIGLIASSYSNRFLGPELKGGLGRISSMISIIAVTANFGLYQPYPSYTRQGEPDVLDKFLRIFLRKGYRTKGNTYHLQATQGRPFGRQCFVHGSFHIRGVRDHLVGPQAHLRQFGKRGLQCADKLCF